MLKLKLQYWPPDLKSLLIWKGPAAWKDWEQEKVMTEDEMVGWHHRLNGHGFGWILGVGDGQGGLACCSSWGHKESDMTERLNWTELITGSQFITSLQWTHICSFLWVSNIPLYASITSLVFKRNIVLGEIPSSHVWVYFIKQGKDLINNRHLPQENK